MLFLQIECGTLTLPLVIILQCRELLNMLRRICAMDFTCFEVSKVYCTLQGHQDDIVKLSGQQYRALVWGTHTHAPSRAHTHVHTRL